MNLNNKSRDGVNGGHLLEIRTFIPPIPNPIGSAHAIQLMGGHSKLGAGDVPAEPSPTVANFNLVFHPWHSYHKKEPC